MCRTQQTAVVCEPAALGSVRGWVVRQLREVYSASSELADDVEVAVSELATNALTAGCRQLTFALEVHRGYVRVAARDDAAGNPVMQAPTPDMTHGRGLMIVDALSQRWGVERDERGKTVWAEFAAPAELRPSFACAY